MTPTTPSPISDQAAGEPITWSAKQLYDAIEKILLSYQLSNWQDQYDCALGLVDRLCDHDAKDIASGQHQVRLICDEIYNEVLTATAPTTGSAAICEHCKCNAPMHDLDCPVAVAGLAANADACEVCKGTKGGVPGNENVVKGKTVCDYCHVASPTATTGSAPDALGEMVGWCYEHGGRTQFVNRGDTYSDSIVFKMKPVYYAAPASPAASAPSAEYTQGWQDCLSMHIAPAASPAASVLTDEQIMAIYYAQVACVEKHPSRTLIRDFGRALLAAPMGGEPK